MLGARVLTAAIGLPLLVAAVLWAPDWLVGIVFMAVALLAWLEYCRLVGRPHWSLLGAGLLTGEAVIFALAGGHSSWAWLSLMGGLGLFCVAALAQYGSRPEAFKELERLWFGLPLVFLPLGVMAALALMGGDGRWWLLFLLVTVFGSDTGAYFIGRGFGRKKLCPQISPAKTWAGAFGGLGGALVIGLLAWLSNQYGAGLIFFIYVAVTISVVGQIGDLVVSMVKRAHAAKDAGQILPGHGGLLDRLDSFIFAAPWLCLNLSFYKG